ncbi:MAG: hypothetical protein ACK5P6_09690 [Pseudobdellovibrionaceae bacterium]
MKKLLTTRTYALMLALALTACGAEKKDPKDLLPPDNTNNNQSTTTTGAPVTTSTVSVTTTTLPVTTTLPGGSTTTTLPVTTTTVPVTTTTVPVTTTTSPVTTTTSPVTTTTNPGSCQPVPGQRPAGTLAINNGAAATKSKTVQLTLGFDEPSAMKISNDADCRCGTWENFSTTKSWSLAVENQSAVVSVQYKDYDGVPSQCVRAYILHDSLAPTIQLSADAGNSYRDGDVHLANLSIKDTGVGLKAHRCLLNGVSVICSLDSVGNSRVNLGALATGSYRLSVEASDRLDSASTASVTFDVLPKYRDIQQLVDIQSSNKVDVLFIVDNSGSMQYEQRSMAQRMSSFMQQLVGLDYRIGITTTDPVDKKIGDGNLVPMTGLTNTFVIDNRMPLNDAQRIIGNTLQRSETGNSSEQGIYATYRSIERFVAPGGAPHKNLFRNDAGFAAVVISDEDESASGPKNDPQNLVNFVDSTWPGKKFSFHSIITIPGDTACRNTEGAAFGVRYQQLSRLTGLGTVGGSIIGSVCATDYGSQLRGIGDSVRQMVRTMDLECSPIGPTNSSVVVLFNGANYTEPYEVQGLKILFQRNLPVGRYELRYRCL